MIKAYRLFDYEGTALAWPQVTSPEAINHIFRSYPKVKRIEVYERRENESIWNEKYLKTYHAKDFS